MNVSVDEKNRRLYVTGDVDDPMMHMMMVALRKLEETEGDITIVFSSEGGEEAPGYAIYDLLTMCKNMVIIEVYGKAWSIAAAIMQAADVRRMAPNATFMIHNGTIPVGEEAQQNLILDMADQIKRDNQRYHTILAARSKLSYNAIEEACEKDSYYTAEEALTAGFCDEILVPQKVYVKPKKGKKKKQ